MGHFAENYRYLRWPIAEGGEPGFRPAQAGALHAIGGHFPQDGRPAIITMPTGSGKTVVLIAAPYLLRSQRVLVLTPSRLVREQIADEFGSLRALKSRGILGDIALPNLLSLRRRITTPEMWTGLAAHDVVVATPATVSPAQKGVPPPPEDLFDLVLVDEAHHAEAATWRASLQHFAKAKQILFTATPFRRDRRELSGRFLFTYHLRDAFNDGAFGRLEYQAVEQSEGEDSDVAIARAASAVYHRDRDAGLNHRIMVRTGSQSRAEELAALYARHTELRLELVLGKHGLKHVKRVLKKLSDDQIDGVVCVDMLGEGFDFPQLKVAALHSPHKSLAVTLQFIGRFARTTGMSPAPATFVALASEMRIERKAQLYRDGAVWEEIIPALSHERIAEEERVREVIESFAPDEAQDPDLSDISLHSLRAYHHVKVFSAAAGVDVLRPIRFPRGYETKLSRFSREYSAALYITRHVTRPKWATGEQFDSVTWDIFIVYHNAAAGLVFVATSSRTLAMHQHLASELAGGDALPLRDVPHDVLNRVLLDLRELRALSMGLQRVGTASHSESYLIRSGPRVHERVSASDVNNFRRGHLFCAARQGDAQVTVGISASSKIWSTSITNIPGLLAWCEGIAQKIASGRSPRTGSAIDLVSVGSEATAMPEGIVYGDWSWKTYSAAPTIRYAYGDEERKALLLDCSVSVEAQDDDGVVFAILGEDLKWRGLFTLKGARLFEPAPGETGVITVVDEDVDLTTYLNERPLLFFTEEFSSIEGRLVHHQRGEFVFDAERIEVADWVGQQVDICNEAGDPTTEGISIQAFIGQTLAAGKAAVVFCDHGAGEMADFIAVTDEGQHVVVDLYHCKKSGDATPGARLEDLYEVCGQVARSIAWNERRRIRDGMERRARARPGRSYFLKGSLAVFDELFPAGMFRHVRFRAVAVQPGLSTAKQHGRLAAVLGAADAFLVSNDFERLRVIASP